MKHTKKFLSQILAIFLGVILLCAIIPTTALGAEESQSFVENTTAVLSSVDETYKKIVIESYLSDVENTQEVIKPCDFIFVLDQSKWMNTEEDKGAQREAIISQLKELIGALTAPTEGEHRVAIAGYGRVNVGATDPYDENIYPGLTASGSGISFNTGYYTTNGFVSQNGWSDLSSSEMSGSGLPKMAESYKSNMTYDSAFMSLSEADDVLNSDTMQAWYSGASRMDAGLAIAEQLATIANEHDQKGDRDLIICILASSLPIQNNSYNNTSFIRMSAVLEASNVLKNLGATIFAFGDYHSSGKIFTGDVKDTEETFNTIMGQVCSKPEYFYSFSNFSSVTEALNRMITQITITAAGGAEHDCSVEVRDVAVSDSDENKIITWQSVLDYYGEDAENIIDSTMAKVEFYSFIGYDSENTPMFDSEPYSSLEVPLSEIASGDTLSYKTTLMPIPAPENVDDSTDAYYHRGNKVSITISAPVTVTYRWASDEDGYAPSSAILPAPETIVLGTTHDAAAVKFEDNAFDEHYEFDGWYMDSDCTVPYSGTSAVDGDITLYGKWEKFYIIDYYWNIWESEYEYSDDDDKLSYNDIPALFTPEAPTGYIFGGWFTDKELTVPYEAAPVTEDISLYAKWDSYFVVQYYWNIWETEYESPDSEAQLSYNEVPETYTPEAPPGYVFGGWFTDKELTVPYEAAPVTADISLYAKWIEENGSGYRVQYYLQNIYDDGYSEVTGDSEEHISTAYEQTEPISKEYTGFTIGYITYEDRAHEAQSEALPISEDGSLVVKVYYNRNLYHITYDGNGADEDTVPTDSASYRYSEEANVIQADSMAREKYNFTHWNTAPDGSGKSFSPYDTFSITEDMTLYAQWEHKTWELCLKKENENGEALLNARFALYTKDVNLSPAVIPFSYDVEREITVHGTTWYLLDVQYTDEYGVIQWENLTEDEYYLLELESPVGYAMIGDPGQMVSALYDDVQEVTVVNFSVYTLPQTGGTGTDKFIMGGIGLMAVSSAALPVIGFKSRKRRNSL